MVYHDIEESNIYLDVGTIRFYFSSNLYKTKFEKIHKEYVKNEKIKFNLKYKTFLYDDDFLYILLYKKIEKRGFRIYNNGVQLNDNYGVNCIISL